MLFLRGNCFEIDINIFLVLFLKIYCVGVCFILFKVVILDNFFVYIGIVVE